MKKIKLLTSLTALPLLATTVLPVVSCAGASTEECTITLTSGSEGQLSQTSLKVFKGRKWSDVKSSIPSPLCATGYKFKQWLLSNNPIQDSYVINENVTLTASYETCEKCDITFDKGEHGSIDVSSIQVNKGTKWSDAIKPRVTPDYTYDFDKWVDKDGKEIANDYVIDSNFTAKATYTNATYTIKFIDDAHSTLSETTATIGHGKTWGEVKKPTVNPNNGYTFDKWVDEDGQEIKKDQKIYYHMTVKAICHEADFATDHWENICLYADQGLEKLKQVYGIESFIGLERTITINNSIHKVRVIDQEHDTITGTTNKATLTFESVTLLSDNKGNCIITQWDKTNNQSFDSSIFYNALNSEEEVTTWIRKPNTDGGFENKSIYTFLKEAGITPKKVDKTVASGTEYSTDKTYSCYCFPLTFTEMGQTGAAKAKTEGTVYKYWADHNNDDARIKYDANNKVFDYWLVSPDIQQSDRSWEVGTQGTTKTNIITDKSTTSVSFAFCI